MSLFIGTLAFDDEAVLKQVRLGVLAASLLSGIVAALLFAALGRSNHVRLRDRAGANAPHPPRDRSPDGSRSLSLPWANDLACAVKGNAS
jgi:hypothetical protein